MESDPRLYHASTPGNPASGDSCSSEAAVLLKNHFEDPYHRGECESATHALEMDSEEFGSLRLSLRVAGGCIREAWFDGEANETAEACASVLCESIEGCNGTDWHEPDMVALRKLLKVSDQAVGDGLLAWLAELLAQTLASPFDADDEVTFQGPHLGEEC